MDKRPICLMLLILATAGVTTERAGATSRPWQEGDPAELRPDPEIQALIEEAAQGARERIDPHAGPFESLVAMTRENVRRMMPQLVYYDAQHVGIASFFLVDMVRLHVEVTRYQAVESLLPYLDSEDAALRDAVEETLERTECPGYGTNTPDAGDYEPNFVHYGDLIGHRVRTGQSVPTSLVKYMMRKDPAEALQVLRVNAGGGSRDSNRALLWAGHVVDDTRWKQRHGFLGDDHLEPEVIPALEAIVDDPRWWVRLYVAEMLRREPELRVPSLLEPLREDENESVRSVLSSFDQTESDGD